MKEKETKPKYTHPLQIPEVRKYYIEENIFDLYFDVMNLVHSKEYDNLFNVVGLPWYLWELYARLAITFDSGSFDGSFKEVDRWCDVFDIDNIEEVKEEFRNLGGFNDLEVLDNVFILPLIRNMEKDCSCSEC